MEIDATATEQMGGEPVEAPDELALTFEEAEDTLELQRDRAVGLFKAVLESPREDEEALRLKESAISKFVF